MASPAHGRTLAVVGATGLVGQAIIRGLAARKFPVKTLLPVASTHAPKGGRWNSKTGYSRPDP